MKFGSRKPTIHDRALGEQVAHQHVPGKAYNIQDPTTRLIHVIGGGFFNEPKYYDSSRSFAEFYAELLSTGRISSVITDEQGLSEQAREVLEAAHAVANGACPEDLLVIAAWARDKTQGLKLRSTPQILFALAAANAKTRPFLARYATSIMQRADEVRQVFGAFRRLFMSNAKGPRPHRGSLPHALRKALALVLAQQSDYSLLKYNGADRPTFADVLKMLSGRKIGQFLQVRLGSQANWPISKAMFEFLVNGKYVEPLPPVLAARRQFFAAKTAHEITADMLCDAALTWENVVSHLGSTAAVWELCIPMMGEMALVRNLRNFEQAEISRKAWSAVYAILEQTEETVQLPFRFFAADREVTSIEAKRIVGRMLDRAVENIPDLPGTSAVFTDNSGSAVGCAIGRRSSLRVSDCGNMLEAVFAKRFGRRALCGVFGDSFMWVSISSAESCVDIKKRIDAVAQKEERSENRALAVPGRFDRGPGVGQSTETGLWFGIDDLTKRKIHVDRIVLLSDLCCYTQGDVNCGVNMSHYFGRGATIQSMIDRYRQAVNPSCYVYSINLNGHSQSQVRPNDARTFLLSGWSEKLVKMMVELESPQETEGTSVPVIESLRLKYGPSA